MPKNCPPDCECWARSFVAISKARDVNALLIEMSMLPIQAPSMRRWETRLPPSSTTAMFIGCLISTAFVSAAAMIFRASSSVIVLLPSWRYHAIEAPQRFRTEAPENFRRCLHIGTQSGRIDVLDHLLSWSSPFSYQDEGLIREVRPPSTHPVSMPGPRHHRRQDRLFGSSQHAAPRPLATRH